MLTITPSEFEQVFFIIIVNATFIKALRLLNLQPARCTNVARLRHLALHSEVVSGYRDRDVKGLLVKSENEIVMKETRKIRNGWLTIRLNEDEERRLDKLCSKTTANSLSEYARNVLLNEPVIVHYRNQTADDFLAEMILLKNELNAIGKNFNQVVHKLHTLDHVAEIKAWTMLNETSKKAFLKKVDEIKEKLNQIHEQWSQK